jgi:hypothetical protein
MTKMSNSGAIADHHTTPQHRAETAYLKTLNVVMTIPGRAGVRALLIKPEPREPLFR